MTSEFAIFLRDACYAGMRDDNPMDVVFGPIPEYGEWFIYFCTPDEHQHVIATIRPTDETLKQFSSNFPGLVEYIRNERLRDTQRREIEDGFEFEF